MTVDSWVGRMIEITVGPIAHGGHCVARVDGRVVFVRHCLPGEAVLARVTQDQGGSFCRADAVQIRQADPDRVPSPCPHFRPGGCGGCDFQHVSLLRQRALKGEVVAEQLRRLAGVDRAVQVVALAEAGGGAGAGLGWRRRMRYSATPSGDLGLRAHRSHKIVPIDSCPLASTGVADVARFTKDCDRGAEIEAARGDDPEQVAVLLHREVPAGRGRQAAAPRRAHRKRTSTRQLRGPDVLGYQVADRRFQVHAGGFWQTHPSAAAAFSARVSAEAGLQVGETALDLYAGAGLFTAALAQAVGTTGCVRGLEADATAVADAAVNLADLPWAQVQRGSVSAETVAECAAGMPARPSVTVLDPPRTGAGAAVLAAVLAVTRRVVIYVACDPAALARDVNYAQQAGWRLDDVAAFDAFPMTHHVECIATLRPS